MSLSAAIIVKDEADASRRVPDVAPRPGRRDRRRRHRILRPLGRGGRAARRGRRARTVAGRLLAAPRNRSLDLATGDWILSVDADEQVRRRLRRRPRVPRRRRRLRRLPRAVRPASGGRRSSSTASGATGPTSASRATSTRRSFPRSRPRPTPTGSRVEPFDRFTIHHARRRGRPGRQARSRRAAAAGRARPRSRPARSCTTTSPACTRPPATANARSRRGSEGIAIGPRTRRRAARRPPALRRPRAPPARQRRDRRRARGAGRRGARTVRRAPHARARRGAPRVRDRSASRRVGTTRLAVGLDDDAIIATGASYDERVFGEWAWWLLGLCCFALGDDAAARRLRACRAVRARRIVVRRAPTAGRGARRRPLLVAGGQEAVSIGGGSPARSTPRPLLAGRQRVRPPRRPQPRRPRSRASCQPTSRATGFSGSGPAWLRCSRRDTKTTSCW